MGGATHKLVVLCGIRKLSKARGASQETVFLSGLSFNSYLQVIALSFCPDFSNDELQL